MILSVSRRTDIPAFYSEWFFNRLKAGYLLVRNPMNFKQVSRIPINPKDVECIVFWTKNPQKMLERLDELNEFNYYFQVTMTSYDKDLEIGVPPKKEIMETFKELSKKIGSEKTIWRYDPIIITDKFSEEYHIKYFEKMAKILSGYTEKCVISFVDLYGKTEKNLKNVAIRQVNNEDMVRISKQLSMIASRYNITIETCSEIIDLDQVNIKHGKCIDDILISRILGIDATIPKDSNQREECGCVKSIDVGIYNTCPHKCRYCYANTSPNSAQANYEKHCPESELLFGELRGDEKITERRIEKHYENLQLQLF